MSDADSTIVEIKIADGLSIQVPERVSENLSEVQPEGAFCFQQSLFGRDVYIAAIVDELPCLSLLGLKSVNVQNCLKANAVFDSSFELIPRGALKLPGGCKWDLVAAEFDNGPSRYKQEAVLIVTAKRAIQVFAIADKGHVTKKVTDALRQAFLGLTLEILPDETLQDPTLLEVSADKSLYAAWYESPYWSRATDADNTPQKDLMVYGNNVAYSHVSLHDARGGLNTVETVAAEVESMLSGKADVKDFKLLDNKEVIIPTDEGCPAGNIRGKVVTAQFTQGESSLFWQSVFAPAGERIVQLSFWCALLLKDHLDGLFDAVINSFRIRSLPEEASEDKVCALNEVRSLLKEMNEEFGDVVGRCYLTSLAIPALLAVILPFLFKISWLFALGISAGVAVHCLLAARHLVLARSLRRFRQRYKHKLTRLCVESGIESEELENEVEENHEWVKRVLRDL